MCSTYLLSKLFHDDTMLDTIIKGRLSMEEPKSYLSALSLALVMAPKKVSDGWGAAFAIRVRTDAQTAFPCSGTGTQTCH